MPKTRKSKSGDDFLSASLYEYHKCTKKHDNCHKYCKYDKSDKNDKCEKYDNCDKLNKCHRCNTYHRCHCYKCCEYYGTKQYNDESENCNKPIILFITNVVINLISGFYKITIFGRGLLDVKRIYIGDIIITEFVVINDSEIRANIPDLRGRTLQILVSGCGVTSNQVIYNFVDSPTITRIEPASGSMGPNINITIFGTNLTTLISITVDNFVLYTTNYPISIISDTMVSFILPYITPVKDVLIYVTTNGGNSNTVTYTGIPAPVI